VKSILRSFLANILGVIAAIATIAGFYFQWIDPANPDESTLVGITFLGLFATYFFLAHLFTRARWERRGRYAESLERINVGFEEVHHLNRHAGQVNPREVKRGLRSLCTNLAEALTYATTSQCFVCLKVLRKSDEHVTVRTLCRDERSSRTRRNADRITKHEDVLHRVEGNTAFEESLASPRGRFISNQLPFLPGYRNTSHQLYGDHPPEGPLGSLIVRYWRWKLPYKSAIVVPITPPHSKDSMSAGEDEPGLVGFLCVDSPKLGVFKDDYDTEIMKGVADGVYNTLAALKGKLQTPSK
jgi:hypothetical protein